MTTATATIEVSRHVVLLRPRLTAAPAGVLRGKALAFLTHKWSHLYGMS